jgi:putative N6-adenine-specific DNA methylase
VHVVVHLDGARVTLALDTSGVPLFKRGYRTAHGEAPLKEDLAAGIVALSGWDRSSPLLDPMCGAGTLVFEAWLAAAGIAPNLNRRFGFERLLDYDPALHQHERDRLAAASRPPPPGLTLEGWDLDPAATRLACAIRDRFFPDAPIHFHHADFRNRHPAPGTRTLVCNPPYGVRLASDAEIATLYHDLGGFLRRHLAGGHAAILTAHHAAASRFGGSPRRSIPLRNGALECRLYQVMIPAVK